MITVPELTTGLKGVKEITGTLLEVIDQHLEVILQHLNIMEVVVCGYRRIEILFSL